MGTNFYAFKKLSRAQKDAIIQNIEEDNYKSVICDVEDLTNRIHLGKKSCGWKFLFDGNDFKYYQPTKESIDAFLREDDMIIVDGNGRKIHIDDFWEIINATQDGIGYKEYYAKYPDELHYLYGGRCSEKYKKYNPQYFEFYSDNLRFSTSDNFS